MKPGLDRQGRPVATSKLIVWRRRIALSTSEAWAQKLGQTGCDAWSILAQPGSTLGRLQAFPGRLSSARQLVRLYGGKISRLSLRDWWRPATRPIVIGRRLRLIEKADDRLPHWPGTQLIVPRGLAFGSGEHATTRMLLRALAAAENLASQRLLDLGTGSSVLALAARALGARAITATDFDEIAVKTARANERENFASAQIEWRVADVRRGRWRRSFDLILANLFSELLVEAEPAIARALRPNGELWMSGVLSSQVEEVSARYSAAGWRLLEARARGKWRLLRWTREAGQ